MIRLDRKGGFTADEIIGRYVFKQSSLAWDSLAGPWIVVRVSGTRAYVDTERTVWDAEGKERFLTGSGEREPDGHMSLSSIHCVCDTAAEANVVVRSRDAGFAAWNEFLKAEKERVQALDGICKD